MNSEVIKTMFHMFIVGSLGVLGIMAGDIPIIVALIVAESLGVIDLIREW